MTKHLKKLRHEQNLTLRRFAELTGMPVGNLSEIETGRREATLEEKKIIQQHINGQDFSTSKFDAEGIGMLPGICANAKPLVNEIIDKNIKNNKEFFDFLKTEHNQELDKKTLEYTDHNKIDILYQKFILAHAEVERQSQKERIATLKIEAILLAKSILNKCPSSDYTNKAIENLEASIDMAIKAIKLEQYLGKPIAAE